MREHCNERDDKSQQKYASFIAFYISLFAY